MSIKTEFSIKDLENLSGVKAHTIRIWEKRYDLLEPKRSTTNIRTYDIANLQKLLNVAILNESGYKVSKIAKLRESDLLHAVRDLGSRKDGSNLSINALKLSMLNFDVRAFNGTYNRLLMDMSFKQIFIEVFIPLLDQISLLWVSKSISPAHEHFVTNLIKQKLLINIERIPESETNSNRTVVLFLPMNEIHDLGLLYIHYDLLLKGYNSIYLGASVPVENLKHVQEVFEEIVFVSYFTVEPSPEKAHSYLEEIENQVLFSRNEQMHIAGRIAMNLDSSKFSKNIVAHKSVIDLMNQF